MCVLGQVCVCVCVHAWACVRSLLCASVQGHAASYKRYLSPYGVLSCEWVNSRHNSGEEDFLCAYCLSTEPVERARRFQAISP